MNFPFFEATIPPAAVIAARFLNQRSKRAWEEYQPGEPPTRLAQALQLRLLQQADLLSPDE